MKLTEAQARILKRLAREPGEGWMTNGWIAEACGVFGRPAWAGAKVRALAERHLIEIGGGGYVRISPAGRAALQSTEGGADG